MSETDFYALAAIVLTTGLTLALALKMAYRRAVSIIMTVLLWGGLAATWALFLVGVFR